MKLRMKNSSWILFGISKSVRKNSVNVHWSRSLSYWFSLLRTFTISIFLLSVCLNPRSYLSFFLSFFLSFLIRIFLSFFLCVYMRILVSSSARQRYLMSKCSEKKDSIMSICRKGKKRCYSLLRRKNMWRIDNVWMTARGANHICLSPISSPPPKKANFTVSMTIFAMDGKIRCWLWYFNGYRSLKHEKSKTKMKKEKKKVRVLHLTRVNVVNKVLVVRWNGMKHLKLSII